jgi:hypothetical protein
MPPLVWWCSVRPQWLAQRAASCMQNGRLGGGAKWLGGGWTTGYVPARAGGCGWRSRRCRGSGSPPQSGDAHHHHRGQQRQRRRRQKCRVLARPWPRAASLVCLRRRTGNTFLCVSTENQNNIEENRQQGGVVGTTSTHFRWTDGDAPPTTSTTKRPRMTRPSCPNAILLRVVE